MTSTSADADSVYRGDAPVASTAGDLLGRGPFAARVADTIRSRSDPSGLVVGLFGAWGEGKTSVLHMIAEHLAPASTPAPTAATAGTPASSDPAGGAAGAGLGARDVALLWFNPWYFRGGEQLVRAFFRELADALGARLSTRAEAVTGRLKKYGAVVAELTPSALGVNPGKAAVALADAVGEPSIEDLRRRVEEALDAAAVQVVVFVDDVDRLDRDEVQAVLKLVKLTAGFRHVTYVLAFDDEMVAAALGDRYAAPGSSGEEGGAGRATAAGRSFLEKIVQVPLHLPPADPATLLHLALGDVDRALTSAGATVSEREVQEFRRYFDPLFGQRRRTLRAGKRYANQLAFALPLLWGEVRTGDLLLLEAVRAFHPGVYAQLLPNRDLLTEPPGSGGRGDGVLKDRKRRWEALLAPVAGEEREPLQDALVHLFPRLAAVVANTYYPDDAAEAWARAQRVGSPEYVDRYFRYTVPTNDVSDVAFARLRELLAAGALAPAIARFKALATPAAADRLVRKFRRVEDVLGPQEATILVRVVAAVGGALPNPRAFFSWSLPFTQAAILIRRALRQVPQPGRDGLALEVVRDAPALAFAVECFRWMRTKEGGEDEESDNDARLLSLGGEALVRSALEARLREAGQRRPFYLDHDEGSRSLLRAWLWYVGAPEVSEVLRHRFDADPAEAGLLLIAATNPGWSMTTGLPTSGRLEREEYDLLAQFLPPAELLGYLGRVFELGDASDVDEFTAFDAEPTTAGIAGAIDPNGVLDPEQRRLARGLARQFASLYQRLQKHAVDEAAAATPDGPSDSGGGETEA